MRMQQIPVIRQKSPRSVYRPPQNLVICRHLIVHRYRAGKPHRSRLLHHAPLRVDVGPLLIVAEGVPFLPVSLVRVCGAARPLAEGLLLSFGGDRGPAGRDAEIRGCGEVKTCHARRFVGFVQRFVSSFGLSVDWE